MKIKFFKTIGLYGTAFAQNKPNVDELLYKFQMTEPTATPTTTDYIASLPEADPITMFGKIVYFVLIVANILAFISFIGSGVFMVISQGNDELLKKAKTIFTYTLFAMLICAAALAIVTGITRFDFFNPR
ncbi:hypothetical protein JW911_01825 [Candidatus Peregrinibacteria bacterium]|nr:hypothetical protein [Candidatus Peregrinibacteria bacterium]